MACAPGAVPRLILYVTATFGSEIRSSLWTPSIERFTVSVARGAPPALRMAAEGTSWSNLGAGGRDRLNAVPILGRTVTTPVALAGRILWTLSPGEVAAPGYAPGGPSRAAVWTGRPWASGRTSAFWPLTLRVTTAPAIGPAPDF